MRPKPTDRSAAYMPTPGGSSLYLPHQRNQTQGCADWANRKLRFDRKTIPRLERQFSQSTIRDARCQVSRVDPALSRSITSPAAILLIRDWESWRMGDIWFAAIAIVRRYRHGVHRNIPGETQSFLLQELGEKRANPRSRTVSLLVDYIITRDEVYWDR